uniref:SSD domain-containing protein n=1 Tax=Macrostomum lignano TaxID=282301 RepID=A0A1I8IUV4_9PLAT
QRQQRIASRQTVEQRVHLLQSAEQAQSLYAHEFACSKRPWQQSVTYFCQKVSYQYGVAVTRQWKLFLFLTLVAFSLCTLGLKDARFDTDFTQFWMSGESQRAWPQFGILIKCLGFISPFIFSSLHFYLILLCLLKSHLTPSCLSAYFTSSHLAHLILISSYQNSSFLSSLCSSIIMVQFDMNANKSQLISSDLISSHLI